MRLSPKTCCSCALVAAADLLAAAHAYAVTTFPGMCSAKLNLCADAETCWPGLNVRSAQYRRVSVTWMHRMFSDSYTVFTQAILVARLGVQCAMPAAFLAGKGVNLPHSLLLLLLLFLQWWSKDNDDHRRLPPYSNSCGKRRRHGQASRLGDHH